jgi:hypothetical protein
MQAWRKRAERLKLSESAIAEIVDRIAHVGDGELGARREYGFTFEEVEDMMLDYNYERCPKCRWFVETHELLDENSEQKACDQCDDRRFD